MKVEVVADTEALAKRGADVICDAVRAKADAVLALPTGTTPVRAYAELRRRVASGEVDLFRATVCAIDEFAGSTRATPGTNSVFYREHLRVPLRGLHVPNPAARDAEQHIAAFADAMRRAGGIDLCVLGIGVNGHIAFNEPGSSRESRARVVELDAVSREAHAASFGSLDRVPHRGMTLGVADLIEARKIIVLAHGASKAAVVRAAIEGPQTSEVPASWLQGHDDVVWVVDVAAGAALG